MHPSGIDLFTGFNFNHCSVNRYVVVCAGFCTEPIVCQWISQLGMICAVLSFILPGLESIGRDANQPTDPPLKLHVRLRCVLLRSIDHSCHALTVARTLVGEKAEDTALIGILSWSFRLKTAGLHVLTLQLLGGAVICILPILYFQISVKMFVLQNWVCVNISHVDSNASAGFQM